MAELLVFVLLATTWLIPAAGRERLALVALLVQYLAVAGLAAFALMPMLAIAKAVVGVFTAVMLFVGGQTGAPAALSSRIELRFLALAQMLAFAIALGLSRSYPLPVGSGVLSFGAYWLALAGLLTLATARRGRRLAHALLMFDSAIYLLVAGYVESPAPIIFAMLLLGNLLLALSGAFLVALERETT